MTNAFCSFVVDKMIKWLIFFMTTAIAICLTDNKVWWPHRKFDQEAWKHAVPHERYVYAKDLLDSKALHGKSEDEVIALLGLPDLPRHRANLLYLIKRKGIGLLNVYILDIRFTDGKVNRVIVRAVG